MDVNEYFESTSKIIHYLLDDGINPDKPDIIIKCAHNFKMFEFVMNNYDLTCLENPTITEYVSARCIDIQNLKIITEILAKKGATFSDQTLRNFIMQAFEDGDCSIIKLLLKYEILKDVNEIDVDNVKITIQFQSTI